MIAVELQPIKKLWKSIMRKSQLGLGLRDIVKSAPLDLADIINYLYALNVKKITLLLTDKSC